MIFSFLHKTVVLSAVLLLISLFALGAERTVTIQVYGMDCPKCANGVAGSLKSLKGVKSADVSVEKARAVVVYDDADVTLDRLKKRIEESGYSTTPKKASTKGAKNTLSSKRRAAQG